MRSTILILLFAALLSPTARAEEKTPEAFARIETELKQERPDAWEIKDIIYHAPAFSADEKQKIAEQIELSALPYKQKIILRNYLGIRRPEKFATLEQKMRQIEEISRRSDGPEINLHPVLPLFSFPRNPADGDYREKLQTYYNVAFVNEDNIRSNIARFPAVGGRGTTVPAEETTEQQRIKDYVEQYGQYAADQEAENLFFYTPQNSPLCRELAENKVYELPEYYDSRIIDGTRDYPIFINLDTPDPERFRLKKTADFSGEHVESNRFFLEADQDGKTVEIELPTYRFLTGKLVKYKNDIYLVSQNTDEYRIFRFDLRQGFSHVCFLSPEKVSAYEEQLKTDASLCRRIVNKQYAVYRPRTADETLTAAEKEKFKINLCNFLVSEAKLQTRSHTVASFANSSKSAVLRECFAATGDRWNFPLRGFNWLTARNELLNLDADNDGQKEILLYADFDSGFGYGCSETYPVVYYPQTGKFDINLFFWEMTCHSARKSIVGINGKNYLLVEQEQKLLALFEAVTKQNGKKELKQLCKFTPVLVYY